MKKYDQGKWRDSYCYDYMYFICQIPIISAQPLTDNNETDTGEYMNSDNGQENYMSGGPTTYRLPLVTHR